METVSTVLFWIENNRRYFYHHVLFVKVKLRSDCLGGVSTEETFVSTVMNMGTMADSPFVHRNVSGWE